jgi:hypothetical protein
MNGDYQRTPSSWQATDRNTAQVVLPEGIVSITALMTGA